MALAKAYLQIEGGTQIPCLYNPEQLSISRRNSWDAPSMPGKGVSTAQFNGTESASMSLELKFDTTLEGVPVTNYTGKILALMEPDPTLAGSDETSNNARPRTVTFGWGNLQSFESVITALSLTFTYFSESGTPLRADMSLTLMQYQQSDAFGPQNPTSGTPRPHRVHRVQPGETLDRISARYYGDSTKWRALAAANNLEDPLAVRPGTVLSIPRLGSA
jgi:hypothetical protein